MYKKLKNLLPALVLLLGAGLWPALAQAAGASISLTANKSTVSSGGSVVVAVYIDPAGTPVNAAEADLTYSASQLQYVGISYSGSGLSIDAPSNGGGGGKVTVAEGTTNPISGSALLATITFRALVGSGSTTVGVAGSSSLVSANDNSSVPYSARGVSFKFGTVASAPSSSAAATTTPAAPKDTTPPVISDVKVGHLTPFSATVSWTTNEPADSDVDFGLDTTYGLSNSSTTPVTAHSVVLSSAFLTPETLFHYHVKSADAAGNVAVSPDRTLDLPGVPVTIIVRGANGKPQAGVSVTLDNATGTTDAKGSVTLPSSLGNKKVTTTYEGVTIQKPITVSKSATALPPYQLDLSKQPLNHWMLTSIGLLILLLVLLGIDALLFGSHFFARLAGLRFKPDFPPFLRHHDGTGAKPAVSESPIAPVTQTPETPVTPPVAEPGPIRAVTPLPEPPKPVLRSIDTLQPFSLRDSNSPVLSTSPPPLSPSPKRITVAEVTAPEPSPSAALAAQLKKPKAGKAPVKTSKHRRSAKPTP